MAARVPSRLPSSTRMSSPSSLPWSNVSRTRLVSSRTFSSSLKHGTMTERTGKFMVQSVDYSAAYRRHEGCPSRARSLRILQQLPRPPHEHGRDDQLHEG